MVAFPTADMTPQLFAKRQNAYANVAGSQRRVEETSASRVFLSCGVMHDDSKMLASRARVHCELVGASRKSCASPVFFATTHQVSGLPVSPPQSGG